jgi:hypothetical protein
MHCQTEALIFAFSLLGTVIFIIYQVHIMSSLAQIQVCEVQDLKAIFHCSLFARAGGATNFNHVKNQSPGHAKTKVSASIQADKKCIGYRQLQRMLSNVRSARAGKATAMENGLSGI